jgi:putative oxidoreductase
LQCIKIKSIFTKSNLVYKIFNPYKKQKMRKLLSTKYSAGAFNTALLLLRIVAAGLMLKHGYNKLSNFDGTVQHMMSFLGMSPKICTILVIFAEFFCSLFLIIGLFTRFACIPLIVTMAVALVKAHHNDFLGEGEMAALYLGCFTVILLVGPGKISVDSMIGK